MKVRRPRARSADGDEVTLDSYGAFEHVPDEVLPGLLATLHDTLRAGGSVFVAEAAAGTVEPRVETRPIGDRTFQVVERRRSAEEFTSAFGTAGFCVEATEGARFVHLVATRE